MKERNKPGEDIRDMEHDMHKGHEMNHDEHAEHMKHNKHKGHDHMVADLRKRFCVSLIITIPILILFPVSSVVFFYGGYPFLKGLFDDLKSLKPGMMTLVAVAITTAYLYSSAVVFGLSGMVFFWELATLIDIMLLGHWIEMKSVMGASKALEELARLMPSEAHKLMPDGSVRDVPLDELGLDDRVLVKPGEKIPADGEVVDGETSVNESMLTGESKPIHKNAGSKVIGGSINGEGSITVKVKKMGKDSFLSQVVELVKEAQESKSKTQDLANRAALWLTIIAITGGAITLFIW